LLRKKVLREAMSAEDAEFCESEVNSLVNLQLLERIVNQEKSKKYPEDWLWTLFRTE
jgi:hypothetical protein